MNFNSPEFAVFFPVVLILYGFVFHRERRRDALLLAASYFFYMSWNWMYAGLLLLATAWDYAIGRVLAFEHRERVRKTVLVLSIVVNLGLLGFFKYFNFFADSRRAASASLGLHVYLEHRCGSCCRSASRSTSSRR